MQYPVSHNGVVVVVVVLEVVDDVVELVELVVLDDELEVVVVDPVGVPEQVNVAT
jgi:hypothetical protein